MPVTTPLRNLSLTPQIYGENPGNQGFVLTILGNPPAIRLRPYQRVINDLIARATTKHRSTLVVLPTGAGKTTVAAELARRMAAKGFCVWFVVHRIELANQALARFRQAGLTVALIAAGCPPDPLAQVQVVMVQTLCKRLAVIHSHLRPDYVFIDEAHHATANQYQRALASFPEAKVIGLSATPERLDGMGLGDTFEALVQTVGVEELIAEGYLVKPLYYAAPADLAGLHIRGGDYQTKEVFARFNKSQLYAEVVKKYCLHGRGYKAICFCVNVRHSRATAEAFCAEGIPAIHLDGETPAAERERILADFAAGKYQVLCNVALFTEGFDLPDIGCVIINRPTQSSSLYRQMAGRGARPTAGFDQETAAGRLAAIAASAKPRFVVIDLGGNLRVHGFWEQPITYSLDAPKKRRRKDGAPLDVAPMRECPKCELYALQQTRLCERCGYTFPTLLDRLKTADFVLAEFRETPIQTRVEKIKKVDLWPEDCRQYYHKPAKLTDAQLRQVEKAAGYKKGWADGVIKRRGAYWQEGARRL